MLNRELNSTCIIYNDEIYYHVKNIKGSMHEQLMGMLNFRKAFKPKFVCGFIGLEIVMGLDLVEN